MDALWTGPSTHHNVLELDVVVDDAILVKDFQSRENRLHHLCNIVLREQNIVLVVEQVSPIEILENNVEVLIVFEDINQLDDILDPSDYLQDLDLVVLHLKFRCFHFIFVDLLDRDQLVLIVYLVGLVNLPEGPLTQVVLLLVVLSYLSETLCDSQMLDPFFSICLFLNKENSLERLTDL